MTTCLDLPGALEAAGVTVRLLDGWDTPANAGYYWREASGDPAGHMHHHTATTGYTPYGGPESKANGFAGLSINGSDRLYQEDYGDDSAVPVYTIANAYPAPISSGAGDITVLERIRQGVEVVGRQGPDTPDWYGNTHYWNTEYVLDGTGSPVDEKVWAMMLTVCRAQNDLMGWTPNMHIGHAHHTRRKIDLWAGQYTDFDETIIQLRDQMEATNVFFNYVMGWFDTLTDEEFEQMRQANLFAGSAAYWIGLRDLGSSRSDGQNDEVVHFYHTVEISGWT